MLDFYNRPNSILKRGIAIWEGMRNKLEEMEKIKIEMCVFFESVIVKIEVYLFWLWWYCYLNKLEIDMEFVVVIIDSLWVKSQ